MAKIKTHQENAARMLMFVSGYVYRLLRYEARHAKIRWTALMVLKDLELLGTVNQRLLIDIEQIRAPTMTVLIRQMERQSWIRRKEDSSDARASLISITPKGQRQLKSTGRILQQRLEAELGDIPPMLLKDLSDSLGALSFALTRRIKVGVSSERA